MNEGFKKEQIHQVGNILEESCIRAKNKAKTFLFNDLNISPQNYIVVTIHREENTANTTNLKNIIEALNDLSQQIPIVFSLHPRTKKAIAESGFFISENIKCITPPSYIPFINLLSHARFTITDSGGVYQEAVFLNIPVLVPRTQIEINEFVEMGKIRLIGQKKEQIVAIATSLIKDNDELNKIKKATFQFQNNISNNIIKIIKERILN